MRSVEKYLAVFPNLAYLSKQHRPFEYDIGKVFQQYRDFVKRKRIILSIYDKKKGIIPYKFVI